MHDHTYSVGLSTHAATYTVRREIFKPLVLDVLEMIGGWLAICCSPQGVRTNLGHVERLGLIGREERTIWNGCCVLIINEVFLSAYIGINTHTLS